MAVSSRGKMTEFGGIVSRKWNDREISPERNKVWIEPKPHNNKSSLTERKVAVVYYLSRNGQLEQPHFMEVPLSSNDGLYLKGMTINPSHCTFLSGFCLMVKKRTSKSFFFSTFFVSISVVWFLRKLSVHCSKI